MTQTFTPTSWTGKSQKDEAPKLPIIPNAPFYLLHSPFSWDLAQLKDEWVWLPSFGELYEIAGVNGVQETRQGADSTYSRMKLEEKGILVLPREFGYLTRYETKFGGYHYRLLWDVPKIIGNKVYWNLNEDEYNQWRLDLLESGVINPPEIEVIEAKRALLDRKIDRKIKFQHVPEVKKELDELYALRSRMLEAYKAIHEPKPATKKKGK